MGLKEIRRSEGHRSKKDLAMQSEVSVSEKACQETLELLEWPRLCEHLSTFASTAQGRRHCRSLVLPPDLATSNIRLAETLEIGELDQVVQGGMSLHGVHDLEEVLKRCAKGGVASGEELLKVADTLSAARRLRRQIDNSELRPVMTALLADLVTFPELEKQLKLGLEDGGRVADRASSKLTNLRTQCKSFRFDRRNRLNELLRRHASFLQDNVIANRHNRPVLAVKIGATSHIAGIVHDSSSSGNTLFVEPQSVIPIGNQIAAIEGLITEEELFLLGQWSADVGERFEALEHLLKVVLTIDLALARARYGYWLGGVPPILKEEKRASFVFDGLRHPLLVWQERFEKGNAVVPVSLEVEPDLRVVAITGPNTGGKTVTLKNIGLAVLMARAGLLLPCRGNPSLPWCAQVLADIGDEQSLQQSLSTFSGHLIRISRILQATRHGQGPTLVLLDEIGAGTDPSEGTSLAIALLKTLADISRLTIATTHFGELKALKYSDSRFENASVAFDSETLTPTYRLQWGIPGRSNALSIAKRLGLDSVVIGRAEKLIELNTNEDVDVVIAGLEDQRRRQQTAAEDAASLLARTEILHDELLSRWTRQSQESAKDQERRRKELEIAIQDGQKEVRNLIKRLRAEGADGETARRAGQKLRKIGQKYCHDSPKKNHAGWIPQVGERIRLLALGKAGEILSISEDGLQLTVLCGVFRSKVDLHSVESLDGLKPTASKPKVKVVAATTTLGAHNSVRSKSNTIDVRGLRVHEAEVAVEDFLRKTNSPIWVVHGVGSGKLKQGLREWLSLLPYVERISDADSIDGGVACTVIWLR